MNVNDRIALALGQAALKAIVLQAELEAAQTRIAELESPIVSPEAKE